MWIIKIIKINNNNKIINKISGIWQIFLNEQKLLINVCFEERAGV